jgi:hypothetical protein
MSAGPELHIGIPAESSALSRAFGGNGGLSDRFCASYRRLARRATSGPRAEWIEDPGPPQKGYDPPPHVKPGSRGPAGHGERRRAVQTIKSLQSRHKALLITQDQVRNKAGDFHWDSGAHTGAGHVSRGEGCEPVLQNLVVHDDVCSLMWPRT